jgi:hypothetical protein
MLMAWGATGIAIAVLVAEAFGQSLRPDTPPAVLYAVLGAFFWGAWTVIRGSARWDLMPQTFYWVLFRYILAVAYGLLASELFTAAFANLGAFVVATLPFAESLRFVRSRLSGQIKGWSPAEGHPRLGDLQGLDPSTVERLEELGVYTTQELALSDPLDLLLRSNFSPKILIDWMDQAFLYNYVGERILELRRRGIRGAIELASLRDEPEVAGLLQSLAQVLGISEADIRNLIRSLYLDNQLRLIWEVWGVFEEDATEDHAQTEGAHETHRSSEDTAPGEDGKSPTAKATPEAAEGR